MTDNVPENTLANLPSYEGRIAIYQEKMSVFRVRITGIRVGGVHLSATIETLETTGLNSRGSSWSIGAHAGVLTIKRDYWAASYAGWQLFFNPAVIQKVLDIVSVLPPGKTYRDDYTTRPAPENSRFVSIHSPGPCARELFSYLNDRQLVELRDTP